MGIQNKLKIRGSAPVSWPRSSTNKEQPNLFCGCFLIIVLTMVSHYMTVRLFHKTGYTVSNVFFFCVISFNPFWNFLRIWWPLIGRYFSYLCPHGICYLYLGLLKSKTKMGVTMHFSEIIRPKYGKKVLIKHFKKN